MIFYRFIAVYILSGPRTGAKIRFQRVIDIRVGMSLILVKVFLINSFLPARAGLLQVCGLVIFSKINYKVSISSSKM